MTARSVLKPQVGKMVGSCLHPKVLNYSEGDFKRSVRRNLEQFSTATKIMLLLLRGTTGTIVYFFLQFNFPVSH